MRGLISTLAAAVVLLATWLGSAQAASVLLSGTVTCGTGGDFNVTGGTFSIGANGTFTFKMTGLQPNQAYGCVLNCDQSEADVLIPSCGVTNAVGKTAISVPGFFTPPAPLCTSPRIIIGFTSGAACFSGFGTGSESDN